MCHHYRIADREPLREFEEEPEEEPTEELAEPPETELEESEREPPLPTADD